MCILSNDMKWAAGNLIVWQTVSIDGSAGLYFLRAPMDSQGA